MGVLSNAIRMGASQPSAAEEDDYQIERSLIFEEGDSAHLSKTVSTDGDRRRWTWSAWIKLGKLEDDGYLFGARSSNDNRLYLKYNSTGTLYGYTGNSDSKQFETTRKLLDPTAWYHIVWVWDSPNDIERHRQMVYINGELTTNKQTNSYNQNFEGAINDNIGHCIGNQAQETTYFGGFMSDVQFIDGLALSPAAFGKLDAAGVWQPKAFEIPSRNSGITWSNATSSGGVVTSGSEFRSGYPITRAFDGTRKTSTSDMTATEINAADKYAELDFTGLSGGGLSCSELKLNFDYNGEGDVTINGVSVTADLPNNNFTWQAVPSRCLKGGLLKNIKLGPDKNSDGSALYLGGIMVDGVILKDGATATSTTRNNPNDGATWSDDMSATGGWLTSGGGYTYTPVNTFNGIVPNMGSAQTQTYGNDTGGTITFAPTGGIVYKHTIELYTDAGHNYTINGGSSQSFGPASGQSNGTWYTLATGSGTLTSLTWTPQNNAYRPSSAAMRIDGHILIDGATDNSFHLKFNDTSSNAAIGTDSFGNGNWTVNNLITHLDSNIEMKYFKFRSTFNSTGYSCAYSVEYSDNNTSWTEAWNGIASTSGGACTLTQGTNGGGSYGAHRWWRFKCGATDNGTAFPRVSRLVLVDAAGNDHTLIKFVDDNCSDSGTIPTNGTTYARDFIGGGDTTTDSPTNYGEDTGAGGEVRGNYCVMNPLDTHADVDLEQGNLYYKREGAWKHGRGTFGMSTGKWYFEGEAIDDSGTPHGIVGIANKDANFTENYGGTGNPGIHAAYSNATSLGGMNMDGSWTGSVNFVAGHYFGVAVDMDAGTVRFYRDGTIDSAATTIDFDGPFFPWVGSHNVGWIMNFGQRPFRMTAPTGYKALCTQNLSDTFSGDDVNNPSKYFNITNYKGTGASDRLIQVGFKPELIWQKKRNGGDSYHIIDQVRGGTDVVYIDVDSASNAQGGDGAVSAWTTTGVEINDEVGINQNNSPFFIYAWDAGSAASGANNNGTINIASGDQWVNTDAGFSITKYTGTGADATFGHGLSSQPQFIIIKKYSASGNWTCQHKAATLGSGRLILDENYSNDTSNADTYWNSTAPTNTLISIGDHTNTNGSSATHICYAWAEIPGYSSFGKYKGNGSANGTFIYTGFRPKFVLVKNLSSAGNWNLFDSARSTYNPTAYLLLPNVNDGEYNESPYNDFLSNGVKLRTNDSGQTGSNANQSGDDYLWAAFAESPFKTSRAR